MKRVNNLYEKMISDENIEKAIDTVNKAHRWYGNHSPNKKTAWVELTKDERIVELRQIIEEGFIPKKPNIKQTYDRNAKKWRDISEPRLYPDQYIHHIMIQVLEPVMMRGMDSFCCGAVKGKGTHYGIKTIKRWMKNDRKGTRWCAELDIYHFYDQLSKEAVMNRMRQLVKDWRILDLVERCLLHGVTIGTYFSQWFANVVLQPLDQIIRQGGVSHYIRYMDNFTIFSNRKKVLISVIKKINMWLKSIGLRLKGNWQYFKTRCRLPDALGYRYGHTFTLIRKHRLLSIKRQVKSFYRNRKDVSFKFACSLISRLSGLLYCNNHNIYRKFIPKGLQRNLKSIIREHQKRGVLTWNTYLEQFSATMA